MSDLARLSLQDPEYIAVDAEAATATPSALQQCYIKCELHTKLDLLWFFIKTHLKKRTIVFLSTCKQARPPRRRVASNILSRHRGLTCDQVHLVKQCHTMLLARAQGPQGSQQTMHRILDRTYDRKGSEGGTLQSTIEYRTQDIHTNSLESLNAQDAFL